MDPIIIQNLLTKARQADSGKPPISQATDVAKDMLKKEVKRQIWLWLLPILGTILPWILVILFVFFLWYAGCSNMAGTVKEWILSKLMKAAGICPF